MESHNRQGIQEQDGTTMKLQKQVAYKYGDKTHYKYVIIIPENMINQLGWQEGKELDLKIIDSKLEIHPTSH